MAGLELETGGEHLRPLTTFNDVVSIYALVRSMCPNVLKYLFFLFQFFPVTKHSAKIL